MTPSPQFEDYCWTVLRTAAAHVGVPALACVGPGKSRDYARVRHIVWQIIRDQTQTSYPMIGVMFGRHHTTAIHARAFADPGDVADVIAQMNGTEVPPAWVRPPCKRLAVQAPQRKRLLEQCPRCGSSKVFRDSEAELDHPERRGRAWFCADCNSQWTRKAAK